MAKRKSSGRKVTQKKAKKTGRAARSAKRPTKRRSPAKRAAPRKAKKAGTKRASTRRASAKARPKTRSKARPKTRPKARPTAPPKVAKPAPIRSAPARLARERRTLNDLVPTPPSSLDMDRRGSAARTGRAEMAQSHANHASMTPDINAGDVDVNVEDAYFVGDESPGGDNPTPDQEVVDEIGKALGVEYQDAEELRGSDKVADRDKHRWELDPASSEDYKGRK